MGGGWGYAFKCYCFVCLRGKKDTHGEVVISLVGGVVFFCKYSFHTNI